MKKSDKIVTIKNKSCLSKTPSSFFLKLTFLFIILSPIRAISAEPGSDPANYAFANYLGTGFYKTSSQNVTVFKIPISYAPDPEAENVMRWRLPVTVGFFDYEIEDIEIPEEVGTLSFVPGLEREYHPGSQWTLIPYFDFGLSKNFSSKEDIILYSTGLTANYMLDWIDENHLWSNKIWYAAYHLLSTEARDDFGTLQTGLDFNLPWHLSTSIPDMRITVYGLLASYLKPIRFVDKNNDIENVYRSVEMGITLTSPDFGDKYLWGLNQIGLGYRDGDGVRVFRLVLGSPF